LFVVAFCCLLTVVVVVERCSVVVVRLVFVGYLVLPLLLGCVDLFIVVVVVGRCCFGCDCC